MISHTILQIIPDLDIGGTEQTVLKLNEALIRQGHRSLVISSGGSLVQELETAGGQHYTFNIGSKNPTHIYGNRNHLKSFIKEHDVDLVHVHSRAPAWSAYLATRSTKTPFITSYHSAYKNQNPFKKLYNSVMTKGDCILVASSFLAQHIEETHHVNKEKIVLIPHGIDLSVYNPARFRAEDRQAFRHALNIEDGVPLIVLPARLTTIKGHELTLHALAKIQDAAFVCVFVGRDRGDNYKSHLEEVSKRLNLTEKIRFLDQADMPLAYASANLVLSPSQVPEGFGLVPVEAQAMGVPVIASDAGATSETILNGETGWLVPLGDSEALAAAIRHSLTLSSEEKRTMIEKSICHICTKFDVADMGKKTVEIYTELIQHSISRFN